jgi:hypothetical protein
MRTWMDGVSGDQPPSTVPSTTVTERSMPKRLLKLDSEDGMVFLVAPERTQTYALLSYCWGGDQSTKTLKSNLESYRRGIRIETLSQSIQDAVRVSKLINMRYLWVDALCEYLPSY